MKSLCHACAGDDPAGIVGGTVALRGGLGIPGARLLHGADPAGGQGRRRAAHVLHGGR